jgi:hypothetical protein
MARLSRLRIPKRTERFVSKIGDFCRRIIDNFFAATQSHPMGRKARLSIKSCSPILLCAPPQTRSNGTQGWRAQALRPDGGLVDDFLIIDDSSAIHVCNAPSPAATAALEIGRLISEKISFDA